MKSKTKKWIYEKDGEKYEIGIIEYNKQILFIWSFDTERYGLNKQGVGSKEYLKIEEFAKKKKIKRLYGDLFSKENVRAFDYFWKKQGFRIINKKDNDWKDHWLILENILTEPSCGANIIIKEL